METIVTRLNLMAFVAAASFLPLPAEPIFTSPVISGEFTVFSPFSSSLKLVGTDWTLEAGAWGGWGAPADVGGTVTVFAGQNGGDLHIAKTTGVLSGKGHMGLIHLETKPFLVIDKDGQGNLVVDYDIHVWHCEDVVNPMTYCDTLPGGVPIYRLKTKGTISASVKWGKAVNTNAGKIIDVIYDPVTDTYTDVFAPPLWEVSNPTVSLFVPEPGAAGPVLAGLAAIALVAKKIS